MATALSLTYDLDPRGVDGEQRAEVRDERGRVELRQRHLWWCDKGTQEEERMREDASTSTTCRLDQRYDTEVTHIIP